MLASVRGRSWREALCGASGRRDGGAIDANETMLEILSAQCLLNQPAIEPRRQLHMRNFSQCVSVDVMPNLLLDDVLIGSALLVRTVSLNRLGNRS